MSRAGNELNPVNIWANSERFIELNKKIETLKHIRRNTYCCFLLNADISIHRMSIIENEATAFYKAMRQTNVDVKKISANTGISQKSIQQIKNHIFKEKYLLGDKIARFDPDQI